MWLYCTSNIISCNEFQNKKFKLTDSTGVISGLVSYQFNTRLTVTGNNVAIDFVFLYKAPKSVISIFISKQLLRRMKWLLGNPIDYDFFNE